MRHSIYFIKYGKQQYHGSLFLPQNLQKDEKVRIHILHLFFNSRDFYKLDVFDIHLIDSILLF